MHLKRLVSSFKTLRVHLAAAAAALSLVFFLAAPALSEPIIGDVYMGDHTIGATTNYLIVFTTTLPLTVAETPDHIIYCVPGWLRCQQRLS